MSSRLPAELIDDYFRLYVNRRAYTVQSAKPHPPSFDGELEAPSSLMVAVHRNYFQPLHEEFSTRTLWSLCNAFTSASKELDPIPQFKAIAKLGEFFSRVQP